MPEPTSPAADPPPLEARSDAPAERLVFDRPVALIGGARADAAAIEAVCARAGAVVAADGGANHLTPGAAPRLDAIIGDMDSVSNLDAWRAVPGCRVIPLAEQDTTDLEKCLYTVAAPLYLGVGFLGDRLDHTLAAAHALLKYADRRVVLLGEQDLLTLCPTRAAFRIGVGVRVSVFPLRPVRAIGSTGLAWPLDGLALAAGQRVGTSNISDAETVEMRFETLGAALMTPRDTLGAVVRGVMAAGELSEMGGAHDRAD